MRTVVFLVLLAASATVAIRIKSSNLTVGQTEHENRIIGGVAAAEGAVPYQISLQTYSGSHSCGGAIIGDRWVLTAAHCILSYLLYDRAEDLRVVTGTNQYNNPGAKYFVDKLFVHCRYDSPNYANDIGLIRLNSSIVFDEKTAKIDLPDKPLEDGDELILTGWGSTVLWGDTPLDLQTVTLNFVPHAQCRAAMDDDPSVDRSHICTFTRVGEGSCHGDSGGPLVHNGMLYGLVNWGNPCALGYPDMHANVYYLLDWVRKTMKGCTW